MTFKSMTAVFVVAVGPALAGCAAGVRYEKPPAPIGPIVSTEHGNAGVVSHSFAKRDFRTATISTSHTDDFMTADKGIAPPIGHVWFCQQNPKECQPHISPAIRVEVTAELVTQLVHINWMANKSITPTLDHEKYPGMGITEKWEYPDDWRGDCEDYALYKKRELERMGWPSSALLLTVVYDERNEGHTILTVRTTMGDLILDNKNDGVRHWRSTPYVFRMIQSPHHAAQWLDLKHMPMPGQRKVSAAIQP